MKKFLLVIGLLLGAYSLSAFGQNSDWPNLARYAQKNKEVKAQPNNGKRVVFLGNSITEGWVRSDPDFFKKNDYIPRGISGQTSYQFLLRFREDVVELQPKIVIINAGTNDIAENICTYNAERTMGNIMSMVEIAKANKIKVILTSVLPASHIPWRASITGTVEKIKDLNNRIQEYAKKMKVPYVDYYSSMVVEGGALRPSFTKDGVHPLLDGYVVMEKLIDAAIKKIR